MKYGNEPILEPHAKNPHKLRGFMPATPFPMNI
jgi:hypothetical protein